MVEEIEKAAKYTDKKAKKEIFHMKSRDVPLDYYRLSRKRYAAGLRGSGSNQDTKVSKLQNQFMQTFNRSNVYGKTVHASEIVDCHDSMLEPIENDWQDLSIVPTL